MTVAVSTWALHREIGVAYWNSPASDVFEPKSHSETATDIQSLAPKIKAHGYDRIELCHFHLTNREKPYLREVGQSLRDAGLTLQTLLIDDGNITDLQTGPRDEEWIAKWVDAAQELGAEGARVIAGKDPWTDETFERSAKSLKTLSERGIRIRIENWFDLLKTPEHVHRLLDTLENQVGLCVDFGNWSQPGKHKDLEAIAGRAETCHAKADFLEPSKLDEKDYRACLEAARNAKYTGPYVLVNGGSLPTEWEALEIQRSFIQSFGGSV